MYSKTVQVWVGIFVMAGMASLLMLSMNVSDISALTETARYEVTDISAYIVGRKVRVPVSMSGVLLGGVSKFGFDR